MLFVVAVGSSAVGLGVAGAQPGDPFGGGAGVPVEAPPVPDSVPGNPVAGDPATNGSSPEGTGGEDAGAEDADAEGGAEAGGGGLVGDVLDVLAMAFGWLLVGVLGLGVLSGVLAVAVWLQRERWLRGRHNYVLRSKAGVRGEDVDSVAAIKPAAGSLGTGELSVVRWSKGGVVYTGLVLCGIGNPDSVAARIAESVGCEVEKVRELDADGLPQGAIMYARRIATDALGAVEAPLAKYAEVTTSILANSDDDAMIIFTVSKMKKWEHRRLRSNLTNDEASQIGRRSTFTALGSATAKASGANTLRCRVVARCEDPSQVETLVAAGSSLDAWPHHVRPASFRNWRWMAATLVLCGIGMLASFVGLLPEGIRLPALIVAGVVTAAGIFNYPALTERRFQQMADVGVAFTERPWNLAPRWHFVARLRSQRDYDPSTTEDERGAGRKESVRFAHPHTRRMLTLSPDQLAGVVYPPPVTITTVADNPVALAVPAPRNVTDIMGCRLGYDVNNSVVRIDPSDRYGGIVAIGAPGTGKTTMVLNVWGDDALMRKWGMGSGQAPLRNGNMTMLCLDVKGDIASRAVRVLERAGYQSNEYTVIDLTDPNGMRIKWLDENNPAESAGKFVDALEYGSPEGAVGGENKPYLTMLLTVTGAITADLAAQLGMVPFDPIRAALILAGGDANPEAQNTLFNRLLAIMNADTPSATGQLLQDSGGIQDQIAALGTGPTGSATDEYDPLNPKNTPLSQQWPVLHRALLDFGGFMRLNQRERDTRMRSTINRLRELIINPHLFQQDAHRPAVTIPQIIDSHRPIVINVRGDGFAMTESAVTRIASMLLHLLWTQARQQCLGWQQQGRSITVYCDEIAAICGGGSGDDVIRDMYDQGRSLGIESVYALQRYGQLPSRTQAAVRNFAHKIAFRLPDPDSAVEAHRALSLEGSPWDMQTIQTFPNFNAVARISANGIPQAPFTLHIVNDDDWEAQTFPNAQQRIYTPAPQQETWRP